MASTFLHFIRHTRPSQWDRELLESFSHDQVALLAKLMGTWYTGSKQSIVTNLLTIGALREKLSVYDWPTGDHDAEVATLQRMAAEHKGDELKRMSKTARVYIGQNKYAMCAALLGWRNLCRSVGQKVLEQLNEELAALPAKQRMLEIDIAEIPVYAPLAPTLGGKYGDQRTVSQLPANDGKPKAAMFAGPVQLGMFED